MPKTAKAVARSKRAGELASSGKSRKAAAEPDHFGPSGATVHYTPGMDAQEKAELQASLRRMFGRDLTHRDIASMVGAPDNATVRISSSWEHGKVQIDINSPEMTATRTIGLSRGKINIHNDIFMATTTGTGLGAKVFGRQVEQAAKLGVAQIDTMAARSTRFNGYYTWARFGYDAPIPRSIQSSLPSSLGRATKISHLMASPQGRAFWKQHGETLDMKFDLTPGSYSRRTLAAYVKEKGR